MLIDLRRRAQTSVLKSLRGSRLFPRTLVNRQGEDARLGASSLDAAVMVYFPGALDTMYQITPWLPTFEAVHDAHRLVVVCQDSRVAAHLRAASRVPVVTVARYGTLDGLLSRSDVGLALYVSHLPRNFENLRFSSLLHAYIGHGDSDKGVSASNQLKAYDYFFAPGRAAVERIAARLMRFDAEDRGIVVGQPVTLSPPPADAPAVDGPRTVLYAPTWEGAQPSVAYSSVLSHGQAVVDALLRDPRYRVLYRPHPLTGVTSRLYAVADRAVRESIAAAGEGHAVVDADAEPIEASMARAHLLVADVSAVTTAWLPSLRPLVVTVPHGEAISADSGLLGVVPRLRAESAAGIGDLLADALADEAGRDARRRLVEHYLSPHWPHGSQQRFVEVVGRVLEERARLHGQVLAGGGSGV